MSDLWGKKAPKYTGFTDENGVSHGFFGKPAESVWEALARANKANKQ